MPPGRHASCSCDADRVRLPRHARSLTGAGRSGSESAESRPRARRVSYAGCRPRPDRGGPDKRGKREGRNPAGDQEPRVPGRHHAGRRHRAGAQRPRGRRASRTPGLGSSIPNADYVAAGATILPTADEVWGSADMILKVKEPIAAEYHRMREGQVLFTYLHLAADRPLTEELAKRKVTAIAYETVELPDRSLPLLAPMSEVAGRLAPQVGANALMRAQGGRGVLMGGVSGVYAAKVVVIGAGVAGQNAATIALGMQAEVLLLDNNIARLRQMDAIYQGHMQTVASNAYEIERACLDADMVIGAVLVPGAKAPKLVTNELVSRMKPGSVLVDIAIDQGGCFEDSRPTTHAAPDLHRARLGVLLRGEHARRRAEHVDLRADQRDAAVRGRARRTRAGSRRCATTDALALGLNVHDGQVTYGAVAEAFGMTDDRARRGARLTSLADAVAGYLDHVSIERGLAANTVAAYRRDLGRYVALVRGARHRRHRACHARTTSPTSRPRCASPAGGTPPRAPRAPPGSWCRCAPSTASPRARALTAVDPARDVRPSAIPRRLPKALSYERRCWR